MPIGMYSVVLRPEVYLCFEGLNFNLITMKEKLLRIFKGFVLTAFVLACGAGFAQRKPKAATKTVAPKTQTAVPSVDEMAEDMNNGAHYNVKKVLQANDQNVKFSGRKDNPELRYQFDYDRLKDPATGEMPEGIREKELRYVLSPSSHLQDDIAIQNKSEGAKAIKTAPGDPISAFVNRGPFNVGGRTRGLALDINDENRILAGGASGGIWLSTNAGVSWQRVSPIDQNGSITAIVQDKRVGFRNTWYASTGEAIGASQSGRNGSARYLGNGIYKSIDNGNTWALLPATAPNTPQNNSAAEPFELIAAMDIDPVNGDLYAATYRGFYRTQDGGTTFQLVLAIPNLQSFGQMDIHISNNRIFYATIPRSILSSAANAGIYRSTTGNLNEWTIITPVGFPATYGRTVIATAPSNNNVMYVIADGTTSAPVSHDFWKYTYVSGDGTGSGGVWENRSANLPNFGGSVGNFDSQGGYDLYVRVHPTNENLVFIGGTNLYRSTNGFSTNTNTAWIAGYNTLNNVTLYPNHHPDQHSLVFYPSNPNKVITGHDGGLSVTQDITTNFSTNPVAWTSLNNGYLTTQVYALAVGPGDLVMAGFQDNSTWSTVSNSPSATWIDQFSGDGCAAAINKTGTLRYVSAQLGVVYRVAYTDQNDNTPNSFTNIAPATSPLFVTQFELDPNDDKLMYYIGSSSLWRANNVTTATTSSGWTNLTTTNTQQLSAIGISTNPSNVVYVGTSGGRIYRLDNANFGTPTYTDVFTGKGLPTGNVSCLAVDPTNALRVLATFSNYNIRSIWLTENGGGTWTNVSGNLEQNPDGSGNGPSVRWLNIVGNNDVYLVGTSTGLYSTKSISASTVWTQVDPTVLGVSVVEQIRSRKDGLVVAGTHGNGLYSANFEVTPLPISISQPVSNVSVLQGSTPVVVPIGNVFSSTAPPVTVTVDANSNPTLVSTAISGNSLTLTFAANSSGSAIITLRGTNANSQSATTTFGVNVNPIISTFPFLTSFPTSTLPFGYEVSGNMSWVIQSGTTPSASSGTGPTGDNTTGTGFYIFTETSGPPAGAIADFTLPVTNISSLTAPNLTFFYHMFGASTGALEVYVRNVATNVSTRVFQLVGQQQTATNQPYRQAFIPLSSFVSAGQIQVFFRGIRGSSFTGDIAIDDISIAEGLTNDVGVKSVFLKNFLAQNVDEEVSIDITNFGIAPQSNFNVSYSVDGGAPVVESYTGTVGVGETKNFKFAAKINRSTRGAFQVVATTQLVGDGQASNNSSTVRSTALPTSTLPYADSFETSDGGWTVGGSPSSWALGSPTGTIINAASDGTKAWVTNLTGNYLNNERSFVVSPLFSISSLSEVNIDVDIMHRIEEGWDGAALQASTDNGATWTNVGVLGDPNNWYNFNLIAEQNSRVLDFSGGNGDAWSGNSAGAGYVKASHAITGLSGKTSLLLRMVFASDASDNFEGMAFDNVLIKLTQAITFNALANKTFGDAPFNLSATASSGLAVTYTSSNPAVATVSGGTVTILAAGQTTITASQPGNSTYLAAANVTQVLTVQKAGQAITFAALPAKTFGDAAFTLTATGGASGLPVTFTSSNALVATVSGNTVTIVGAGTTNITANQADNDNYAMATPVVNSLVVNKANQAITFAALPAKTFGDAAFALSANSSSGLAVTFESLNDKVTISGSTATLAKAGSATIRAKQVGNNNYEAAPSIDRTFCINPPKPSIALSNANSENATLTSNATTGNQWFLNGSAISGATGVTYKPTSAGSYTVMSTVEGCSSLPSDSQALIVTGDISTAKIDFALFPNPVGDGELNVVLKGFEKGNVNLKIVDMLGKVLQEFTGDGGEVVKTDVSRLAAGQYIVQASQYTKKASGNFIIKK